MREAWIMKRADEYHAKDLGWREAYEKARADAALEWPLYQEHQYADGLYLFDCDPIYRFGDGAWRK